MTGEFRGQPVWIKHLFYPMVIGTMMGCIALSLVELIQLFVPSWNGAYLIVACGLTALEANYSLWVIRVRNLRGEDALRFRASELITLFILLRIGSYAGKSWRIIKADLQLWLRQPWAIFDPEIVIAFGLIFLAWLNSTKTFNELERIGELPEEHRYYVPPRQQLANRFFTGGVTLMIIAGVTRIGIAALLDLSRPPVPGLILNVLVYFLLGIAMLGQIQALRLRQRWHRQRIEISPEVASRWVRYSLAFVGLAALIAFLLPTGYTVGLLDTVGNILAWLLFIMNLVVLIIMLPISWLLRLILSFFGEPPPLPRLDPSSLQPPAPSQAGNVANWFETFRSLLFWAITLGIAVYAARSYLRDRPELLTALTSLRIVHVLRRFWAALWRRLIRFVRTIDEHLPRRISLRWDRRTPSAMQDISRFLRLSALSPRERILYYYLSILQRADRQGIPRRKSQTPYEYYKTLIPHLEQIHQELTHLTQSFVEARYSQHEFNRAQEQQIRARWKQVKAALRAMRQERQADGD